MRPCESARHRLWCITSLARPSATTLPSSRCSSVAAVASWPLLHTTGSALPNPSHHHCQHGRQPRWALGARVHETSNFAFEAYSVSAAAHPEAARPLSWCRRRSNRGWASAAACRAAAVTAAASWVAGRYSLGCAIMWVWQASTALGPLMHETHESSLQTAPGKPAGAGNAT